MELIIRRDPYTSLFIYSMRIEINEGESPGWIRRARVHKAA